MPHLATYESGTKFEGFQPVFDFSFAARVGLPIKIGKVERNIDREWDFELADNDLIFVREAYIFSVPHRIPKGREELAKWKKGEKEFDVEDLAWERAQRPALHHIDAIGRDSRVRDLDVQEMLFFADATTGGLSSQPNDIQPVANQLVEALVDSCVSYFDVQIAVHKEAREVMLSLPTRLPL